MRFLAAVVVSVAVVLAATIPTSPPVVAQDSEPTPVADAFETRADASGSDVLYFWTLDDVTRHWRIELEGPAEERVEVRLATAEGVQLDRSAGTARAALYDLALAPGAYIVSVVRSNAESLPFRLLARPEDEPYDPEPNDTSEQAVPLADGGEVAGRLAREELDLDRYRLTVPAGPTMLRDVRLEAPPEADLRICLLDEDGREAHCRRGRGGAALLELGLPPGDHVFEISGTEDPSLPYTLRVDPPRVRAADAEAEPNDSYATASAFDAALGVSGRSSLEDPDVHAVVIEGEPQLWSVELSGPQLERLSWVRGDGREVAAAVARQAGDPIAIHDLFLVPGTHRFRVRTHEGEYQLRMTPRGRPDPEAEREPNGDEVRAESYRVGERRLGRLVTPDDVDLYRFTLAAPDHLRLRLEQPADAELEVRLRSGDREIVRQHLPPTGGTIDLDLWLRPGDHLLSILPRTPSEGTYVLTTERLDPFVLRADQEPNDVIVLARPAPAGLRWEGDADVAGSDLDGTWLPPLERAGPISIRVDGDRPGVRLFADPSAGTRLDLEALEDGSYLAADPPVDEPLYLQIQTSGPYSVALEAPGWDPGPAAGPPPLELAVEVESDAVAAYWPGEQRLDGVITLTNPGSDDLEVSLEAVTSHYAWQAQPEVASLTLPAGSSRQVPLSVRVAPDAWADEPVRVSLAARALDGGQATAAVVIDAAAEAAPVGARRGWAVPDALLGGLNVASLGLGGRPATDAEGDRELALFDGLTPPGGGFGQAADAYPHDIGVDLAGDGAIPVAGTIINPLAWGFDQRYIPHRFELLLSSDGQGWTSALAGELLPLPIDQAFVLDEPMSASHAMLRVHSDHSAGTRSGFVALGEWKVVARPGVAPDVMPADIADPVRGGHVVHHRPYMNGFEAWYGMLDDDLRRQVMPIDPESDDRFELVIGFQDGRAAQVEELRWLDPTDADPETQLLAVDVHVSTEGPLGPWQDVGTWRLDRDGGVATLSLREPSWARYVRLTAPLPAEARALEAPGRIEVLERPTDEGYRSILGEWGYASSDGPYEWLVPSAIDELEPGPDAGDTREAATPLPLTMTRADRARILEDVDWYRVVVPPGANTLTLDVAGMPTVGVRLSLLDSDGASPEMRVSSLPGGVRRHEAIVEPGSYDVLVEQVPFSIAFTFDTSGSMGPYLDFVFEGMREFALDVEPGREMVIIIPFERPPLLEAWQDQPLRLAAAVDAFVPREESSAAEKGLLASTERLAGRDGARAILIVTDAETGSLELTPDVWEAFDEVRPTVYSVHVGSSTRPFETRNLMRSWAQANGGHYAYPVTHAEMERAFERMSTRLRRPALYTLTASTALVDRSPGSIAVVAPPGRRAALAPGVGVEIILDTSASMRRRIDGRRRIAVAKASLRSLVRDGLAEGVPVALRTFGAPGRGAAAKCGTTLDLPLRPLDRDEAIELIDGIPARRRTATPIGAALARVREDLAEVSGSRTVVLVTDGDETCEGDPAAVIAELQAEGVEVNLNIVGFALDDEAIKAQMAEWAAAGGGTYFDAAGADELADAIITAVSAPFRVYPADAGDDEAPVAHGTVGADPVVLDPGSYRVEVLTDPVVEFERVELGGGQQETLTLPGADDG